MGKIKNMKLCERGVVSLNEKESRDAEMNVINISGSPVGAVLSGGGGSTTRINYMSVSAG